MPDRRLYVLVDFDQAVWYGDQDRLHIRTHHPQRMTRCALPYADLVGEARRVPRSVICTRCQLPANQRRGY